MKPGPTAVPGNSQDSQDSHAARGSGAGGSLGMRVKGVAAALGLTPELVRFAAIVFLVSRGGFVIVTELAVRFLRPIGGVSSDFVGTWARFDATYYARLARDGYQAAVLHRTAFFPLQPLAIRLLLPLVSNIYLAGLIVSNLCFLIALLGLIALVNRDAGPATARRAVLYITLFPTALFFFAGYAESLFLALAVWCVFALRRGAWWQAGLLGMLAALTRQMGVFLVLPFLYEYARQINWRPRAVRLNVLWVLLIPFGLVLFMGVLWRTVGDPMAFIHAEHYWSHSFAFPWVTLWSAAQGLFHQPDTIFLFKALIDLAAVLLFGVLIVVGIRRQALGDTLYSAAVWLLAVCYPTQGWPLQSDARYMLAAFPCLILLARGGRRPWLNALILVGFGGALLIMTQYFVRGAVIL